MQVAVTAIEEYIDTMQVDGSFDGNYEPLADLSEFLGADEYGRFEDRFRQA